LSTLLHCPSLMHFPARLRIVPTRQQFRPQGGAAPSPSLLIHVNFVFYYYSTDYCSIRTTYFGDLLWQHGSQEQKQRVQHVTRSTNMTTGDGADSRITWTTDPRISHINHRYHGVNHGSTAFPSCFSTTMLPTQLGQGIEGMSRMSRDGVGVM
jgi:hypothetical protein